MALKPCKECGAPVSEKAESCPMCGAKQPKETSLITWICVGLLGLAAVIWMFSDSPSGVSTSQEPKPLRAEENKAGVMLFYTQQMIKKNAKDPSSVEFRGETIINESEDGAVACAQYNAKNSFGAYVGYKSFVAVESTQKVYYENGENPREFAKYWNKHCV